MPFDFQAIFDFLNALNNNNNREWMEANKPKYTKAKDNFVPIIRFLIEEIGKFDEHIHDLEPKKCIFRIHRDIRFSKDKTPFKTNFGAWIAPGGKNAISAGYYFHLQPGGESFVAGGLYMPPSDALAKVRQEIDYNAEALKEILNSKSFKKYFKGIQGEQLKKAPKGYPKDHPDLDLLRFKSFVVWYKLKDEEIIQRNSARKLVTMYETIKPFNDYLNVAIS